MQNNSSPLLEITIISAQGLKTSSFAFSKRIRPFITLSTTCTSMSLYKTSVDDEGGVNPTWGDKFRICLDQTFFNQRCPGIYLQLYTKRLLLGKCQIGWCCIPATDITNQISPAGSTQFLSYRIRDRDGTRGHGVINVAVRLNCSFRIMHPSSNQKLTEASESNQTVIGIPVFQQKF